MKKAGVLFITLLIIAVLVPNTIPNVTAATEGHIPLLALIQEKNETFGDVADLSLEIREGEERVFLDTFPLTKIGTQISMRFAQQYVCQEYECKELDFIYTIRAKHGLVGGPSAGGAAAILTKALLQDDRLDPKTVMTGTINAGGLIGQVGGVKEKIGGAAKAGFEKVLIPRGTRYYTQGNKTTDLVEYGQEKGIDVIEINTFDEAYQYFTGRKRISLKQELEKDAKYQNIMKDVAEILCKRSERLLSQIENDGTNSTKQILQQTNNFTKISNMLFNENEYYYSAASYCFRANIAYKTIINKQQDFSEQEIANQTLQLIERIKELEEELESKPISTITDLQTYMIVRNRILEAKTEIENSNMNNTDSISYVEERIFSVQGWMKLFNIKGQPFTINKETLKKSCIDKIKEAEERYNYASSLLPFGLIGVRETLDTAYDELENEEYAVCLFEASTAKAEADQVLSSLGIQSDTRAKELILTRLNVVEQALIKAERKGIFPVIGYTYYEYAKALTRQGDIYSGLLFSGYALEMTNVDIYFEMPDRKKVKIIDLEKYGEIMIALGAGIVIGAIGMYLSIKSSKRKKK